MVHVSGAVERPVVFGRARHLAGVECRPPGSDGRPGPVALFINAGIVHRVGPHRIYVRLARALAGLGVASLRFDLSGIGSSRRPPDDTGARDASVRRDIDDALDHVVRRMGATGVVTAGLCSGADRAFETALGDGRVTGVVLIDPDVHVTRGHWVHRVRTALPRKEAWTSLLTGRYLRMALETAHPRDAQPEGDEAPPRPAPSGLAVTRLPSREVREWEVAALLERGVRLHYLFTGGLTERYNHREQLFEAYPVTRDAARVRLDWFPEADHTFSAEAAQRDLEEAVCTWCRSWVGPPPARETPDGP